MEEKTLCGTGKPPDAFEQKNLKPTPSVGTLPKIVVYIEIHTKLTEIRRLLDY